MEVNPRSLVEMQVDIEGVDSRFFEEFNIAHVTLTESLMSPTLQTKVNVQSYKHNGYVKDWDQLANKKIKIKIWRNLLLDNGYNHELNIENTIYRVSDREQMSNQLETFNIMAIDDTALVNAEKRISKSWKCTTPSEITSDVLKGCVKVPKLIIEQSTPARTFFAENIHPYQVVAQQADVALANSNDPSFLHYITYENILGTHRFESLYGMTRKSTTWKYDYSEAGVIAERWENINAMFAYINPCDYDILSDAMNGVDRNTGKNQQSLMAINPFNGIHSIIGGKNSGCGMGGQETDTAFTNKGSAGSEPNCEIDVEKHKLTRTARLGLLDQDKVAFRLTVAFNPNLHVGKMIELNIPNKLYVNGDVQVQPEYSSGNYLISALTHRLVNNGFGTTVIDCISKSVGNGGRTLG